MAGIAAGLLRAVSEWCGRAGDEPFCRLVSSLQSGSLGAFREGIVAYLELLAGNVERRLYGSAGPLEHWRDSVEYGRVAGLVPWACSHESGSKRGGPHWQQLYRVLADPYTDAGLLLPINVYWASGCGAIGLGVVVAAEVSHYTVIWSRESCPPRGGSPCYSIRWYTLPLLLAPGVSELQCRAARALTPPVEPLNCAQSLVGGRSGVENARWYIERIVDLLRRGSLDEYVLAAFELASKALHEHVARPATGVEHSPGVSRASWLEVFRSPRPVAETIVKRLHEIGVLVDERIVQLVVGFLGVGNVLLVGPPGMGKTLLARLVAEAVRARLYVVTGHAGLTRADIIGGPVLADGSIRWRSGVFLRALLEALRGARVLLLLDEVNRMDVDRVAGELFTIFSSPSSRGWDHSPLNTVCLEAERYGVDDTARELCTALRERSGEVAGALRERLRVAATMNTIDYATLFTVGEALARRFFKVTLVPPPRRDAVREEVRVALEAVSRKWSRGMSVKFSEEAVEAIIELFVSLRGHALQHGLVTPLAIGPGAVRDLLDAAASAAHVDGSDTVEKRHVCAALEAIMPVNALLDDEWRRRWEEAVKSVCS